MKVLLDRPTGNSADSPLVFPRKHLLTACALASCLVATSARSAGPEASPGSPSTFTSLPLTVSTASSTGFSSIAPFQTGVHFTNRLPALLAAQNQNLMNGSGVAAGDFDGDGHCDLYFCAIAGPNALYRNLGNWRFEEMAAAAGVVGERWVSSGATFADLDGDGDLDLLVATLGTGVQCLRNLGTGRFQLVTAEAGLTSTSGSTTLALGDVDGDGDLDLYVVNYGAESVLRSGGRAEIRKVNGEWVFTGPNAHRLRYVDGQVEEVGEAGVLYLNDGKGRFDAVPWNSERFLGVDGRPKPPPLDYGLGAQMRDINGDGAPDIYICNDFQMPDRLWINDGRGRFREAPFQALRKFPFSSMGVDFGDLDRDGHLDFLVVEMASREHARAMRQVSGSPPSPNLPGRYNTRHQIGRNTLYRSNGDGSWSEIAEYAGLAATDWSWQPVFLDVDLDGYEDVLVANGMMFDTQDRDTLARINALGRQSPFAARTNLLLYPPYHSPNAAFRNLGKFSFHDASTDWRFDSTRISQGVALADLDNDGDADLVINCLNDVPLLYRNDAVAPRLAVRLQGLPPNTFGIGARIRVEGGPTPQFQEIVAGGRYLSGDDTFRTFACGTATQLTVRVTWRSGRVTTVPNAVPNTLLVITERPNHEPAPPPPPSSHTAWFVDASSRIAHAHHEALYDDFVRQPLLHRQLSSLGPGVAFADLDNDGRDELVIGTGRGGVLGAFRFSTNGAAIPIASDWIAPDDVAGLTGWITGDGRPALLAAVAGYEADAIQATRLFEIALDPTRSRLEVLPLQGLPAAAPSLGPVAATDFDGDGDLDLFVGSRVVPGSYPRAPASYLFRQDRGKFAPEQTSGPLLENAGMVSGALWSDLENDGFPDLILACEWGPIRILRNVDGRFTSWDPDIQSQVPNEPKRRLSDLTGWWTALTAGDFNSDGRLDLVAANWGLNTGYRASADRPVRLHFGKLSGTANDDLIESYFANDSGKEVPRRSLNALGRAFPFLAGRFPSHQTYGEAGIHDVLSSLPARPLTVSATTLTSMLFLNSPTGFVAVHLPAEAQYAPVLGLSVADADGDGHHDLFIAQNFFATRIEWPRCDAGRGLWLRGDGTGRLAPLPSATSGVVILGEQRGVAVGDIDADGQPDLAVTQNGAATTLWQNSGSASRLRVNIVGPPGNPSGFGVTLRPIIGMEEGPAWEIRGSTGYWSKDSATVYLAGPKRPEALRVRWPGGREQRVAVPPGAAAVRVEYAEN